MKPIEHLSVGQGRWPVVVIDDYHDAPDRLLAQAGELSDFNVYKDDFYPGVKRSADNADYARNFTHYAEQLSTIFDSSPLNVYGGSYAVANAVPDDLLPIQRIPHYDTPISTQLAMVHYLCDTEFGGTAFYRHRSTQIERVNLNNEQRYQQALGREATTHGMPPAQYINGDTELFSLLGRVEAKFNRAVIYPASLLHSGVIANLNSSSSLLSSTRLTITAYLDVNDQPSI